MRCSGNRSADEADLKEHIGNCETISSDINLITRKQKPSSKRLMKHMQYNDPQKRQQYDSFSHLPLMDLVLVLVSAALIWV